MWVLFTEMLLELQDMASKIVSPGEYALQFRQKPCIHGVWRNCNAYSTGDAIFDRHILKVTTGHYFEVWKVFLPANYFLFKSVWPGCVNLWKDAIVKNTHLGFYMPSSKTKILFWQIHTYIKRNFHALNLKFLGTKIRFLTNQMKV